MPVHVTMSTAAVRTEVMSEYFRKLIRLACLKGKEKDLNGRPLSWRDPPPAAHIRFRCAKLHRVSDGKENEYNTIYDVLKSRGWKETDVDSDWIHSVFDKMHLDPGRLNMKRMKRQCEKEGRLAEAARYNICPITFVVPQDECSVGFRAYRDA
ncbi:Ttll9 [Symbiodinium necroappetens]|uniref:Ttll9 protein n=1 Tax=Symbiodinium necroappetens TaxID=1628268 RepID=A0A812QU52_9DINO|nr:Ttll9 [Symbiodinium necroappetens]